MNPLVPYPTQNGILGEDDTQMYAVVNAKYGVVKSITLINNNDDDATINVWVKTTGSKQLLTPSDFTLKSGRKLIIDNEYTLGQNNVLSGNSTKDNVVYQVSVWQ